MKFKRKVWVNKGTKQMIITIPKDSEIKEGDYVEVIKIKWESANIVKN